MKVKLRPVGPFVMNCYVAYDSETKDAVIIDAGNETDKILEMVREEDLKPLAIINTHAHLDHASAVAEVKRELDIPFYLHEEDLFWLEKLPEQAQNFGLPKPEIPEVDHFIHDGDMLTFGTLSFQAIHTPGHTPGGVSFYVEQEEPVVFVGDCLFAGSIGRTDFPRSSHEQLIQSIKEKILPLGDAVTALPGHGPATTLGREKTHNPFL